jgi:hypothetical protein
MINPIGNIKVMTMVKNQSLVVITELMLPAAVMVRRVLLLRLWIIKDMELWCQLRPSKL